FYAVLHALLIISKAARRLGREADTFAPNQPWQSIRSLGNVLRHAYDGVDPRIIWRIVHDDLAGLKRAVDHALARLQPGEKSQVTAAAKRLCIRARLQSSAELRRPVMVQDNLCGTSRGLDTPRTRVLS